MAHSFTESGVSIAEWSERATRKMSNLTEETGLSLMTPSSDINNSAKAELQPVDH